MTETLRCNASNGHTQCRATKELTNVLITIHREPKFDAKLPGHAIIKLCPRHLKMSWLERLVATNGKHLPPKDGTLAREKSHAT